jgi:hypothetical protein
VLETLTDHDFVGLSFLLHPEHCVIKPVLFIKWSSLSGYKERGETIYALMLGLGESCRHNFTESNMPATPPNN